MPATRQVVKHSNDEKGLSGLHGLTVQHHPSELALPPLSTFAWADLSSWMGCWSSQLNTELCAESQ